MSEAIAVGTAIGDYVVRGLLGKGGMGAVYRAEHRPSGEQVALKVLADELFSNAEFRRRFVREARYATEVSHPNVVRVREVGEVDGRLYMVQELVAGTDLRALLLLEGALDAGRTTQILGEVAAALDALHATGLVHRDVKPGNVLIAEESGRAYLTDFGLSKNPTRDSVALTTAGEFVGSFFYAAPEQVLGRDPGRAVDVYSLGCMLFECLTGEPPFVRERAADLLEAHMEDLPPAVTAKRPDLSPAIDGVVARAMAKEPGARYSTCQELMEAAMEALGETAAAGVGTGALELLVTGGRAAGGRIRVAEALEVGRGSGGDGELAGDPELSRRHAFIRRSDEGWQIQDLGSTNGTLVGGTRIETATALKPGDVIELGGTTLAVESTRGARTGRDAPGSPPGPAAPAPAVSLSVGLELVCEDGRWRLGEGG